MSNSPLTDNMILFGFPRSGNTWVRYIMESVYGKPSYGPTPPRYSEGYSKMLKQNLIDELTPQGIKPMINHPVHLMYPDSISINYELPIYHCHLSTMKGMGPIMETVPPMIFVLRDPIEAVVRHCGLKKKNVVKITSVRNGQIHFNEHMLGDNGYMETLNFYNLYEGKKMLVHYEDLIDRGELLYSVLSKINEFCEIDDDELITSFIDYIELHVSQSFEFYETVYYSKTKGKKRKFYCNYLKPEIIQNLYDDIINRYSYLHNLYLKGYTKEWKMKEN